MSGIEAIIIEAESAINYDLENSPAKCRRFIGALRKLVLRRPKSVSIDGNPVSFEAIQSLLVKAEAWLTANDTQSASTGNPSARTYDMSGVRD